MGWSNQNVIATYVIVEGPNGGLFVYSPAAGTGNLIASTAGMSQTDKYGNLYLAGQTSYGKVGGLYYAINLDAGNLNFYHATSEAGPWIADGTFTDLQQAVSGQPGMQTDASFATAVAGGGTVTYPPSADNTGITDTAAINAFLALGWAVRLVTGTYYIDAPIVMPPGGVLEGAGGSWANTGGQGTPAPPVTQISASSTFSGSAMVIIEDAILGGFTDQTTNVQLRHFTLNGSATSGSVAGILLHGPVWGTTLEDLGIYKMPAQGINTQGDATNYPTGQSAPYGIHATRVKIDTCAGVGIVLGNATDCQWNMVQVIGCTGNGWNFNTGGDHRLVNCSAENGGAIGFNVTFGGVQMVGCRTNANTSHGISFNGGSVTNPPATLSNCRFIGDGTNGTGFGININAPAFPVHIGETYVSPAATFPATALNTAGTPPYAILSNSLFWGETATGIPGSPASWLRYRAIMGGTGASPTYTTIADAN